MLLGMYGAQSDESITELGFIVEDLDCVTRLLAEQAATANRKSTDGD